VYVLNRLGLLGDGSNLRRLMHLLLILILV
jgi:hypothetical protein